MTKVKCEICGEEFEMINKLHLKKHGITREEYMNMFPDVPLVSDEYRKKMSEATSGEKNGMFGHYFTQETKNKLSNSQIKRFEERPETHGMLGKHHTEESNDKNSESNIGRSPTQATRDKLSKAGIERFKDPKERDKISEAVSGENNGNYKGGISFLPYCEKFNNDLKERVFAVFGRICMKCDRTEQEVMDDMIARGKQPYKLTVHHVNYEKMVCCNDVEPLFVPLCIGCNAKVNGDREYWEQHFTNLIDDQYNGKCFYTKEEVKDGIIK